RTGGDWVVWLIFRVGGNPRTSAGLRWRLGIEPLNETPELGVQVYGNEPRVWVTNHKGPWQSVVVKVHKKSEIDTPAFRAFLKEAVTAFHGTLKRLNQKPEDLMPWKINGERWHLGEKGFPAGKKVHWDRALLPRLLELVREIEPGLEVRWDVQYFITLRVPGIKRAWGQWVTKDPEGLDCRFLGKKGQFNLSRVEQFGTSPTLNGDREDGEMLRLVFVHHEHVHAPKLKELLVEHLRGFRQAFGKTRAS